MYEALGATGQAEAPNDEEASQSHASDSGSGKLVVSLGTTVTGEETKFEEEDPSTLHVHVSPASL